MNTYIALLRAVNVGGTGKLPMDALRSLCAAAGFSRIETYIASGNVVFDSDATAAEVRALLQSRLLAYTGKAVEAFVRTARQLTDSLEKNPFQEKEPGLTYLFFLHGKPPADALDNLRGHAGEELCLGHREVYVHYPQGMGQSKLRIPAITSSTARNVNTVTRLVALSSRDES